jgi:hypothetical protein
LPWEKQIGVFCNPDQENALYSVVEVLKVHQKQKGKAIVFWVEIIEV